MLAPSIDCVRVITMEGSTVFSNLQYELQSLGLWNRTVVQIEQEDPDGGAAGCFRAHVRAWNSGLTSGCSNLLILEDDAFFDTAYVQHGFDAAEAFLQSSEGTEYDLITLGWAAGENTITMRPVADDMCVFWQSGEWRAAHAYVASRKFMNEYRTLEWDPNDKIRTHIDLTLSSLDRGLSATVRPMVAFQRFHESNVPWCNSEEGCLPEERKKFMQLLKSKPCDARLIIEKQNFDRSGLGGKCAPEKCLPSPAAAPWRAREKAN
jgi:hypothetical protein